MTSTTIPEKRKEVSTKTEESFRLTELPNNILLLVFQYADPSSLEALSTVDKRLVEARAIQLYAIAEDVKSENFDEFNKLNKKTKNLVRALYYKKYNQVFIDEETSEDINQFFTNKINKAKTSNQLNFNDSLYSGNIFTVLSFIPYILPNLQFLSLDGNKLTSLPENLNLPKLKFLSLRNIKLISVPECMNFQNFPNLQELYLWNNQLESLPENFYLPNLQKLSLNYNQLTSLPENLNLPNLKWLNLWENKLISLPENFGQTLPNLQELYLWNNQLTSLPENLNLPNLQKLNLRNNKLTNLPKNLNLPNLKWLNLMDNNLNLEEIKRIRNMFPRTRTNLTF